ncbi:MAG: hypothetical protein LBF23_00200, partial [Endomicrobium sp.]|nr:hypothetical protein [Endomicrobium sp.]
TRGEVGKIGVGAGVEVEVKEKVYVGVGVRGGRYEAGIKSEDMWEKWEEEEEKERGEYVGEYVGGRIGGRHEVGRIGDKVGIEIVGGVEMMYISGKEVEMKSKERIRYEGERIGKVEIGVRGEYEVKEKMKVYGEIGSEYEMKGEVRARLREEEIPKTEVGGMIGVVEVGMRCEIGKKIGIEGKGKGYVGEREGTEGKLNVRYKI